MQLSHLMSGGQTQDVTMGRKVEDHSIVFEVMNQGVNSAADNEVLVPLHLVCRI